jgi:DNA-binding protein H-NS
LLALLSAVAAICVAWGMMKQQVKSAAKDRERDREELKLELAQLVKEVGKLEDLLHEQGRTLAVLEDRMGGRTRPIAAPSKPPREPPTPLYGRPKRREDDDDNDR